MKAPEERHMTIESLRKVLQEAADACNVPLSIGTHSLRKTFGYWHYKKTEYKSYGDLTQLQHIYGHSTANTTIRYLGISEEEEKQFYHEVSLDLVQAVHVKR